MAVLTFTPRAFGGSGTAKSNNGEQSVTYRVGYIATCTAGGTDTEAAVYKFLRENSGSYPWYGKPLSLGSDIDNTVQVSAIDVNVIDGSDRDFEVLYTYSPTNLPSDFDTQPGTGGKETNNPIEWLDDIDVTFTQTLGTVEFGVFHGFTNATKGKISNAKMTVGKTLAISNSACIPYDPPVEAELDIQVVRIAKNVFEYDGALLDTYSGAVNSDEFQINMPFYRFRMTVKPRQARIRLASVFNRQNGIKYWRQTAELMIDRDRGWRKKILDRGMAARREVSDPDGSGSTIDSETSTVSAGKTNHSQNTDSAGYPLSEPVLFDGNGQPQRTEYPPTYGEWQVYREIPFAPLAGKAWSTY